MDCNNGSLHQLNQPEREAFERDMMANIERDGHRLAPLNERQHKELTLMNAHQRKGYMRNQPCVCGSGKKFKRCCWSKYA